MNNPANNSDLKIINGIPMMGSKSISEMTGKDHSSIIVRDIKNMLKQLNIYPATPQDNENKSLFFKMRVYNGREVIDEVFLDQGLSTTLVTGYSVKDRYKIVKRWSDLESGKALPLIPTPEPNMSKDILLLARVVAEATASATMKAVIEVTNPNVSLSHDINNSANENKSFPSPLNGVFDDIHEWFANNPVQQSALPADEFVPIHKISWETGLSDASCRRLVTFASLPASSVQGIRGICVNRGSFIGTFQALLEESTPPAGKRKRWKHPEFGGFELRKTPAEIFGEEKP
ncbi:hypothetical protein IFU23_13900 [Pantoea agglomerans]|uniref:hypothetical protein n=1 Tax=Enterobacter agglomerans TaxID=549 RepID=UPI00177C4C90|nr:hypothetical protein [Pantoea agglomerans]MBD8159194.1 hypothetical protein [Pantoea agglomerans]MBD8230276.1 hypothetical protein [Pantoea agglomerans]